MADGLTGMHTRTSGNYSVGERIACEAFASPRLFLALTVGMAALLLVGVLGYNSRDTRSLRKYKARLRAQGERLTLADLEPAPGIDYSSAALLMGAGSRLNTFGLCPGNLDLMVCVAPGRAKVAWKQDTPPWINTRAGQQVVGWDEFGAGMGKAADSLAALREVLKDPPRICRAPGARLLQAPLPNLVHLRLTAQWMCGDAVGNLREGRMEEALQDLEALAACAQVNRDDYTLVAQMIRVAIAGLGLAVTWEALQAPGWTERQLERLQKAWEPVDLVDALERGFVGIRAGGEETWGLAHRGAGGQQLRKLFVLNACTNLTVQTFMSDYVLFPIYKLTGIDEDELFYLESIQGTISAIRLIKKGQPWTEAADGLNQASVKLDKISRSPQRFQHWLSFLVMPNCIRAVQAGTRNETLRQLTLTAIALKRFQMRHGTLPLNLRALSPEILAAPTYDPLSGQPLQYIVKDDGRYILYSVGQDGRDDGGETPFWYRGKYGLWEEPDAVWPEAMAAPMEYSSAER
ncbi:MAG TPA: hypothetical protein VJA21_06125 [Verrucomicrobiae bacterium]